MNYDSRVEDSNGKSVKTVKYTDALEKLRKQGKRKYGNQAGIAKHYECDESYISEIFNMRNNRVMTNEMLADIGMRWCSVITKK